MEYFSVAFIFGAVQIVLLRLLLSALTGGKGAVAVALFICKFLLYGFAIAQFMFRYLKYLPYCSFGYIIGMVLTAFGLFIYSAFFKKQ